MRSLPVLIILFAFGLSASNNSIASESYQMVTSTDGNIYRLDKGSGDLWLIKGTSMEKVMIKDFRVKIGQRYIAEDTYSFKYIGKGQVGDIKSIGDYWLKDNKR